MRITLALLLLASLARADAPKLTPAELAAQIDAHIERKLAAGKVPPAPLASDAELVRRLSLDVTGRIPDLLTALDFIDSPARDKREKLVARLLASDRYSLHWANVWRTWLINDASDLQVVYMVPGFEGWLRERLKVNARYDQMVRTLLTFNSTGRSGYAAGVQAFYQSLAYRPENVASAATRLFLGVKLECAQCHNHPFARWTKKQFWETAAFFSGVRSDPMRGVSVAAGPGRITIPGTDKEVSARFLDGKEPKIDGDPRAALLDWMTAKDNPYFARAAVNRVWEQLLGTGLVEPLDEETTDNPASHPELLTLLARQFAAHDHDLKYLIQAILLSRTYQRSSRQTHARQADPRLFARAKVRGLTPEQLFDSLTLATGKGDEPLPNPAMGFTPFNATTARADFLRRFPNQDRRSEQQTSILQALYLMNGTLVTDATSLEKNENLRIIASATAVRTSRRIGQLFLITLARKPTAAETARLVKYVDGGGPGRDPARALCDVFWALLNSSEFCSNH